MYWHIKIQKRSRIILVLLTISQFLTAQSLSRTKAKQVESFIKEWGYLKYYQIQSQPLHNIDSFFVTVISSILQKEDFDEQVSKFRKCFTNSIPPTTYKSGHYFVSSDNVNAVLISKDTAYHTLLDTLPPIEIRLLTLAKIWCIVDYFSPYKNFSNKNWSAFLVNEIRKAGTIKNSVVYNLWLLSIISNLQDGHAAVTWKKSLDNHLGRFKFLPYSGKIIRKRVYITGFTGDDKKLKKELLPGDQVTRINGIRTKILIKKYDRLVYNYSNSASKNNTLLNNYLFRGDMDSVQLEIKRDGQFFALNVQRFETNKEYFHPPNAPILTFIADSIAYLNMGDLYDSQVDSIVSIIHQKAKHLVIDIRNYPNNTWMSLSSQFGNKPFIMSKITCPDLLFPGSFKTYPNRTIIPAPSYSFAGKIVLLVDETTRSHAEFSAMGLQAACRATTIGTTTAGVIGNITNWIPLPGGFKFRFSGLGVY